MSMNTDREQKHREARRIVADAEQRELARAEQPEGVPAEMEAQLVMLEIPVAPSDDHCATPPIISA